MKKSLIITIIVIILLLIAGFFLFSGEKEVPKDNNQALEDSLEEYSNLETDNDVFNAIDESVELLE